MRTWSEGIRQIYKLIVREIIIKSNIFNLNKEIIINIKLFQTIVYAGVNKDLLSTKNKLY